MTAYDPSEWSDLFVACAGAAAALAGLLFVAVSINLERILTYKELPGRALETVILLVSVVVVSIFALASGQSHRTLAIEVLVVGVVATWAVATIVIRHPGELGRLPVARRQGGEGPRSRAAGAPKRPWWSPTPSTSTATAR